MMYVLATWTEKAKRKESLEARCEAEWGRREVDQAGWDPVADQKAQWEARGC